MQLQTLNPEPWAQELQAQVRMATEQQVAAQRELHETRLQGRAAPVQNGARSFNPDDAEGVHSIIEGLEQAGIGALPVMVYCSY